MLIAWSFGAGLYADAFIVAFRLPNLFRRLVGEGALGMALIPVLHAHARRRGARGAIDLAVVALQRLAVLLLILVVLGLLAAPVIVRVIAPGFAESDPLMHLTVQLTRIMMPYLLMVGLVALSMGILNALGHFTTPAMAPAVLNVAMITAIVTGIWLTPSTAQRIVILAVGVLVGGLLQLVMQIPVLVRHGVAFWRPAELEEGVFNQFGRSALPVLLGGATYQINVLMGTLLASFLASGSVSYLFYADRLVQFPLGLFAVSAVTVMMPDLSRQAVDRRPDAVKATLRQVLGLVGFVIIPAMVGLVVLREPIVAILFERGAFGSDSTRLTAEALLWYGVGLWAYAALRILLAVFYALQDAFRPLKAAAVGVAVNLGMGAGLMPLMGHGGIALAASMAAAVNVILLVVMLRRRIGPLGLRAMLPGLMRICTCALIMGVAVARLETLAASVIPGGSALAVGRLAACIVAGMLVYAGASFLCRSPELRTCWRIVFRGKQLS
jgi:putative peptidoglycan lipid II flippase